jgi:phage repressor protein C with HTH and peptisase S24 domain
MHGIATRTKALREKRGLSQTALADMVGVTPQSIQALEAGGVRRPKYILNLGKALGVDPGYLESGDETLLVKRANDNLPEPNAEYAGRVEFSGRKIPVYGQARGGADGEFEWNGERMHDIPCPPQLDNVDDAYGVYVAGDSMSPRYDVGEVLYVNPLIPPRPGHHVVVQVQTDEHGPRLAFVKKLVRYNTQELVLEQYNPPRELTFDGGHVHKVHVIVGTYFL